MSMCVLGGGGCVSEIRFMNFIQPKLFKCSLWHSLQRYGIGSLKFYECEFLLHFDILLHSVAKFT